MSKPYPKEFRDDVVRVARNRGPGVDLEQIARDFGIQQGNSSIYHLVVALRRAWFGLCVVVVGLSQLCVACGTQVSLNPAPGKDACVLLASSEITAVTQQPVIMEEKQSDDSSCRWQFESSNTLPKVTNGEAAGVALYYEPVGAFDGYTAGAPSGTVRNLPNLGDQAYLDSSPGYSQLAIRERKTAVVLTLNVGLVQLNDKYMILLAPKIASRL